MTKESGLRFVGFVGHLKIHPSDSTHSKQLEIRPASCHHSGELFGQEEVYDASFVSKVFCAEKTSELSSQKHQNQNWDIALAHGSCCEKRGSVPLVIFCNQKSPVCGQTPVEITLMA